MKLKRKSEIKNENNQTDESIIMTTVSGQKVAEFPPSVVSQLRRMVTRVKYTNELPKQFSLVSAIRGEGVTYMSWALSSIIANDLQATVCAVELNWWFPATLTLSGKDSGISAVLQKKKDLNDVILKTHNENFDFIPAGLLDSWQRAVFAHSDELKNIIAELRGRYDYVLIDVPAILSTSDAIPLASLTDSCCLVIRQGVTQIDDVRMALDDVSHLPMLGVIMNQVDLKTPSFIMRMIPQS